MATWNVSKVWFWLNSSFRGSTSFCDFDSLLVQDPRWLTHSGRIQRTHYNDGWNNLGKLMTENTASPISSHELISPRQRPEVGRQVSARASHYTASLLFIPHRTRSPNWRLLQADSGLKPHHISHKPQRGRTYDRGRKTWSSLLHREWPAGGQKDVCGGAATDMSWRATIQRISNMFHPISILIDSSSPRRPMKKLKKVRSLLVTGINPNLTPGDQSCHHWATGCLTHIIDVK